MYSESAIKAMMLKDEPTARVTDPAKATKALPKVTEAARAETAIPAKDFPKSAEEAASKLQSIFTGMGLTVKVEASEVFKRGKQWTYSPKEEAPSEIDGYALVAEGLDPAYASLLSRNKHTMTGR